MTANARHPWHPYEETFCAFAAGDGQPALEIDLRAPVAPATRDALHARLGGAFSIVTACNPSFLVDGPTGADANRRAHERLVARVRALGVRFVEATGRAAGGGPEAIAHEEVGLAFALVGEPARRIAVEFGQDAYFEFDGERFAIAPACRTDLGRAPLP